MDIDENEVREITGQVYPEAKRAAANKANENLVKQRLLEQKVDHAIWFDEDVEDMEEVEDI